MKMNQKTEKHRLERNGTNREAGLNEDTTTLNSTYSSAHFSISLLSSSGQWNGYYTSMPRWLDTMRAAQSLALMFLPGRTWRQRQPVTQSPRNFCGVKWRGVVARKKVTHTFKGVNWSMRRLWGQVLRGWWTPLTPNATEMRSKRYAVLISLKLNTYPHPNVPVNKRIRSPRPMYCKCTNLLLLAFLGMSDGCTTEIHKHLMDIHRYLGDGVFPLTINVKSFHHVPRDLVLMFIPVV